MDQAIINNSDGKLINETSQYLQAQAMSPVNWHPWHETTLELAQRQDKPILLSIGYLTCHQCHMLSKNLFADVAIAANMNRLFVNILVDKQERPDLDKIYQATHQIISEQPAGWPLIAFLSPHTLMPYFSGTYFTKDATTDNYNLDFIALLHRLHEIYYHDKERIQQQELHTTAIIAITSQFTPPNIMPHAKKLLHAATIELKNMFDPINTGFGQEGKFPNTPMLDFILDADDILTRHIALTTLNHMAESGIYDQIDGGFFGYTIDHKWQIPHFEKMLVNNVQLLSLYAKAYHLTKHRQYYQVVEETITWLKTNLYNHDSGAFYNGLTGGNDVQEGLYYLWDKQEIKNVLTEDEYKQINNYYNLHEHANLYNKWHLHISNDANAPSADIIKIIKLKLLERRNLRSKPEYDRMILTSSNSLAIANLSIVGQLLQKPELLILAATTIKFIQKNLYVDGQLYALFQNGKAETIAFIDDYAFLLHGILTLIDDDREHELLTFGITIANDLINNFYDPHTGGFYFTAKQAEKLFYRPKLFIDEATPSGNGIACISLLKLGRLVNNLDYINIAKNGIVAAAKPMIENPASYLTMCKAYALLHNS